MQIWSITTVEIMEPQDTLWASYRLVLLQDEILTFHKLLEH